MGEVYRARDTRLERDVAVKVLPSHLASSLEVRQRFEREAKTISRLSHPHICALYDVGREGETEYLVMELLEGETLSDRLAKGPLPLEQTLRYGVEIADALDKAHRQGIVHRDLKPGNVMLTKSGVKILDFGLAKAMEPETSPSDLTSNPTAASRSDLTQEGTLLGTLPYMAPELFEGKKADGRTDVFALGATLYEMVTGKRAFSGSSRGSLVASILRDEPAAVTSIQPLAPQGLDRVIRKCLAKNPEDRWQSAADLGSELSWIAESRSQAEAAGPEAPRGRRLERSLMALGAALLVALVVSLLHDTRQGRAAPRTIRFSIAAPENTRFFRHPVASTVALSPDGSTLAFVAIAAGKRSLWVRPFSSLEATRLGGTEGAVSPFWSPDGRFVGFFAQGKLQKIAVAGGPPQALCESSAGISGTWGGEGTILYSEGAGGARQQIFRVSAEGGAPAPVAFGEGSSQEGLPAFPTFLPDGRHFLFTTGVLGERDERRTLWAGSVGSREARRIGTVDSRVAYSDPGYLLFARDGTLLAEPFDAGALKITGDSVPIGDRVWSSRSNGTAAFSASGNGSVVFQSSPNPSRLTWRDRSGRETGSVGTPTILRNPRLSPDGTSVAVEVADVRTGARDIWIYEGQRGLPRRFTTDPADVVFPIWSPTGERIAFGSLRGGPLDIYVKSVNGVGAPEPLLKQSGAKLPQDWSPDGSQIVYEDLSLARSAERQLEVMSTTGKPEPRLLLSTTFNAFGARYSPDGQWIAFVSEESGSPEVCVVPVTGQGRIQRISVSGGSMPRWRRDGKELFFAAPDGSLMAVATETKGAFEAGVPAALFAVSPPPENYDVAPDGSRFLFQERVGGSDFPLTVVVDWTVGLKK